MNDEQNMEMTVDLVRLPLWKSCVESMLKDGVEHGKTYSAEYFETALRCKRDEMKFGLAISEIRRALESKGFYLSGRGLKGNNFIILPASDNRKILSSYSHAALDSLKRGVILGTNTRLDILNQEDRRRHESMLEKLATRYILMKRSSGVVSTLKKHNSKLLV